MAQIPSITAQPPATSTGLVDLEKELSCSICTDVLYQPLTLLDCLHTFCGSCLKEWFGWQRRHADQEHERSHRSRRRRRRKPYAYTCPSCRATVRETRPNATVTTLLDMYLAANPSRKKTDGDKKEISRTYRIGDDVLIQPSEEHAVAQPDGADDIEADSADEEDRRLLEHVQQMSLRDAGVRENAEEEHHSSRHHERRNGSNPPHHREERRRGENSNRSHARGIQLGHQSSLRSLLRPNDSNEVREEILRQITEEGLLDDIDWDNIQVEQEDEISERIVEAYRRRRRHRSRHRGESQGRESRSRERARARSASQRPQHVRAVSASAQPSVDTSRPPVSRPHLFETTANERHRHRRSSSQGNAGSSRPNSGSGATHSALRSATDLSEQPRPRDPQGERPSRVSHENRRLTDVDCVSASEQWRNGGATATCHPRARHERRRTSQPTSAPPTRTSFDTSPAPLHAQTFPSQSQHDPPSFSAPLSNITVSCDRCGRGNIQRSLHYTCTRCGPPNSTFDLCLRCYRLGRGCMHWFGFGHAAWPRWHRKAPPGAEAPHVLRSQKYIDPHSLPEAERPADMRDPVLQLGVFCDVCHENANGCYWHCAQCNDGEWGYCHRCVNQGRHCSHPLLPMALQSSTPTTTSTPTMKVPNNLNPPSPHSSTPNLTAQLHPLILPTTCNICNQSIPTQAERLHCPDCAGGDYDVCMSCYSRLTAQGGVISPENGLRGARKCANGPNGHKMTLIDFAVSEGAENYAWRRVLQGPVGGWETEMGAPSSMPGIGRVNSGGGRGVAEALWAWIPEEDENDLLGFPRGALIEKVASVNDEFSWGVYCRKGGYFPSAYIRVINI